jgi:hypothetical protein
MAQNVLAWKCNCKTLEDVDLFSKSPDIYYKGKPQKSSLLGRILTISYAVIYAAFFVYKIVRMALKIDVSFYETQTWTGEIPSLELNNNHFYGAFALMDVTTGKPFIDESIYYPVAYFVTGIKKNGNSGFEWEYRDLGVEPCQLEKFGEEFRDLFKGKLDGLYCLKNADVTIQGHTTLDAYSYFYVAFYPCVNGKRGRNNCADSDTVKMHLTQTALMVKMEDIELTPQLYKTPVQVRTRELTAPVMDSLYNNIQAYFHIIEIQTDNDILGFEAFSIKKKEKHFKYDVTFMVNSINSVLPTNSGEAYCNIQLQLTEQMISINRTYTKLIEVLGDVGGLMEFVFSFFKLISIFITEALYEKGIINHLFSFDIDKKVIELKNSNKNILLNKAKTFKSLKHDYKLSSNILVYSNENTTKTKSIMKEGVTNSENKLNYDNILSPKSTSLLKVKNKRKIKKKKLVRINTVKSENEDIKSKQILKNNLKDENEIKNSNFNFGENIIETEKVSRRKISKLTFTKVDLYVCFLCTRKRKKIQNILIDEGMNMFSEKLDVINIFTKLMKIEDFENLAHKEKAIEMSDECKKRLQDFNYPKNLE